MLPVASIVPYAPVMFLSTLFFFNLIFIHECLEINIG